MPIVPDNETNIKQTYIYTEHELADVQKMAANGLSIKEIAEFLYISLPTFKTNLAKEKTDAETFNGSPARKAEYLDQNLWFRYNQGVRAHKLLITKGITQHAMNGNPQVLMFLARSRLGWNDRLIPEDTALTNAEVLKNINVNFIEPTPELESKDGD